MKRIKFSKNWNNKLNCDFFSTIRVYHSDYYRKDEIFEIELENQIVGHAKLISINPMYINNIDNVLPYIDAAMDRLTFIRTLKMMYSNKYPDFEHQPIAVLIFKNLHKVTVDNNIDQK